LYSTLQTKSLPVGAGVSVNHTNTFSTLSRTAEGLG